MLVFAASDKGGTGRSITSCNMVYRHALHGHDACYLDFDFGSPTAGSIFQIPHTGRGTREGGLHSYFSAGDRTADEPRRIDIWRESARPSLRRPPEAGRLTLIPGDQDGAEFPPDTEDLERCSRLLLRLNEEFDLCIIDLSAGRSYATQMVLEATATAALRNVTCRWLVFHRWTRQHIPAAAGLAFGRDGILEVGTRCGHDKNQLRAVIRFVRTAVVDPNSPELSGLRPAQIAWLRECNQDLRELAARYRVGRTALLGSVPLDPVLQWREQLLSDHDVYSRDVANRATIAAFDDLARKLVDGGLWQADSDA
jgi:hypothetical protein